MTQISKKFILANAVDQSKIRLSNNAYLKARNAADNADINMLKVNASDKIEFASVPQVTSDPSTGNDLVRKSYLDTVQQGLKPKQAVRAATTANIVIATALNSGDVIDGITLANGDRVLVKDQTASEFNGIYIVGATPARATDFDSLSPIDEINGAYTFVQEGSANQGKAFVQSGTVTTLDTDPISFVFFNSAGTLIGQDGITISGADVSVDHDGQGLTFSGVQLALELDGSTLSKSASGLKVADLGIGSGQLASNAVTTAKINNDAVDKDKIAADVAGNGLGQNVDGSLEVNVDGSTLEINTDSLRVKDLGITSAKLAADSVITSKILDANVTNAKIASGVDAIKIADGSVSNTEFQYINSLTSNAQDQLDAKLTSTLADGKVFIGSAGNLAVAQTLSGDISNTNAGVVTIANDAITTVKILDANVTNAKIATGVDAAKIADGSVSNTEFQYINSLTSNAQTQINARIQNVDSEQLTLNGTDITNQYKDLSFAAYSASSISLTPVGGIMQNRGVDYSVSLAGGAGGVTRITFLNDLATGGAAELISGDILIVQYARL